MDHIPVFQSLGKIRPNDQSTLRNRGKALFEALLLRFEEIARPPSFCNGILIIQHYKYVRRLSLSLRYIKLV